MQVVHWPLLYSNCSRKVMVEIAMQITDRVLRLVAELCMFREENSFLAVIDDPFYSLYLTGTETSHATILIDVEDGDLSLSIFTDNRYIEKFQNSVADLHDLRVTLSIDRMPQLTTSKKPVYLDESSMTLSRFKSIFDNASSDSTPYDIGKTLQRLRSIKDDDEIEKIGKATEIADESLLALLKRGLVGRSEVEVRRLLDLLLLEHGADAPSFPTIVASGSNASMPHATPSDRVIQGDDLVIIDFGATFNGYHSDTTRTIKASNRDFSAPEARIIEAVLAAHQHGVSEMKPGRTGGEIDMSVRNTFSEEDRPFFIHGLGHGVGLEIHEYPFIVPNSTDDISPRNVATIEPGLYFSGNCGVRIEDCYVISEAENIRLSRLPLVIA